MSEPRFEDALSPSQARGVGSFGWRRRQLLVDARYQLHSGVLVGAVAIVLLLLLNASLLFQDTATRDAAATPGRALLSVHDRTSWAFLILGSAVFWGGVVLIGVLESHRTAGAAYAIRRAVEAIRDGQSQVRVRLRRGDNLQDLARTVNQLAETIDAERLRRS